MKQSVYKLVLLAVAACAAVISAVLGCGGSGMAGAGSAGSGTLAIHMSDGGGTGITSMVVTIDKIEANINGQWQTLSTASQTIDLLSLVKTDVVLASAPVPAGEYNQVRLFISSATVTDSTGTHPVTIPSGMQTGLKINIDFAIAANQIVGLLLDFNVGQSLVHTGNGKYLLKPVIPAVVQILSGTITGTATDASGPAGGASVTATYASGPNFPPGTVVNTTTTMADGTFKVWALLPGTYTVTFSFTTAANVTETATVSNVVVVANQNTDVGTVVLH